MGNQYDDDYDEHDAQDKRLNNQLKDSGSDALNQIRKHIGKNNDSPSTKSPDKAPSNAETTNGKTPNISQAGDVANKGVNAGTKAAGTAAKAGGSGAAGAAGGAGATGTGAGLSAGASAAGAGAAGAGGGIGSGAAMGAAAGPIGAAIGAAAGATVGKVAKNAAENKAKEMALKQGEDLTQNVKAKKKFGDKTGKTTTATSDNTAIKVVAWIMALIIAVVLLIGYISAYLVSLVVAPVMYTWEALCHGFAVCQELLDDLGTDEPTYEDIINLYNSKMKESLTDAYVNVCYKEVYQIALEQGYDLELTLESYNNTEFPYILDGENCNVNYAELINLLSMSEEFGSAYYNYDYEALCAIYDDEEFKRTLYDLIVVPKEKLVIKDAYEGSAVLNEDGSVAVYGANGACTVYRGDNAAVYTETVIYGEVTVNKYPLKKLYNYFGVDPYGTNASIPSLTNYQALGYLDHFAKSYTDCRYLWGYEQRTPLVDYTVYTGELTVDVANVYEKDIYKTTLITAQEVYIDTPEYKQGDSRWSGRACGSGTMGRLGCCVTAMAMVCDHYSSEAVNPGILLDHMNAKYGGQLQRRDIATDYGFMAYDSLPYFNVEIAMGELSNDRLIIAHIRSGAKGTSKYGHYVVLTGYKCYEGASPIFTVNEPASRIASEISMQEATEIFDGLWSYGY